MADDKMRFLRWLMPVVMLVLMSGQSPASEPFVVLELFTSQG